MRLRADLTLLFISIVWGSAFVAQRIAGWLVLEERLSGKQLVGCLMIFGAVALSKLKEFSKPTWDSGRLIEGR